MTRLQKLIIAVLVAIQVILELGALINWWKVTSDDAMKYISRIVMILAIMPDKWINMEIQIWPMKYKEEKKDNETDTPLEEWRSSVE